MAEQSVSPRRRSGEANRKHWGRGTPEYGAWVMMRTRCRNPNFHEYPNYGGRGITICAEWETFPQFLADMGPRPSADHSIDRKDNDGPYAPWNCRWATEKEQQRNKRTNRYYTWCDKTLILADWEEELGISWRVLYDRLNRLGWSVEAAFTTPLLPGRKGRPSRKPRNDCARYAEYLGERLTLREWSERTGLSRNTLICRLRSGWSVKDALTVPHGKSRPR